MSNWNEKHIIINIHGCKRIAHDRWIAENPASDRQRFIWKHFSAIGRSSAISSAIAIAEIEKVLTQQSWATVSDRQRLYRNTFQQSKSISQCIYYFVYVLLDDRVLIQLSILENISKPKAMSSFSFLIWSFLTKASSIKTLSSNAMLSLNFANTRVSYR